MKKLLITLLLFSYFQSKAQDTTRADAKLTAATVYFGYGAELTHQAKVNVNTGTKKIILNQLSTSIDINSLQISVPEQVALLSQRFNVYYPTEPVFINPLVKKIKDSMAIVQKELKLNENLIDIEESTLEKTGKLIEITITNSGNKTVSADDALKLINSYTAKIEKAKTNIFNLMEAKDLLNEKIAGFSERINVASRPPVSTAKAYGQLILDVICNTSADIPVSFSYFSNNAGWTPLYDIRVNSKTNDIKLVYKASITQSTGIDWKQSKLTISTSNPSFGGTAPILSPWYLQQYVKPLYNQLQAGVTNNYYQQNIIQSMNKDDKSLQEVVVTADGINRKQRAYATQTIDPSTLQHYTTLTENQLNTNYEIDLPYTIESDGQLHSVTIKEEKMNAALKNYAVPKLDRDAYLLAEVADWQTLNLLPGMANIIMDNTYIGKSMIDPNSTADTLNLSLGKDKRVAIKRSVVKDYTSTKTNGNTTKQLFTYELTVKNNKSTAVDLLLKDQYPLSNVKEIEIKLDDSGSAMVNEETGVLTWKISLQPGESKKLRFSYIVKYPKEIRISNL